VTVAYNEINPFRAEWLRNLSDQGAIAYGTVWQEPIQELKYANWKSYKQVHFCAGIGLWSLACRWAGIVDDQQIWTASLPCQPFSNSGARKGIADDRHLWPYLRAAIEKHRPGIVVGEQVGSPLGRDWLRTIRSDFEAMGYRGWAIGVPACVVGAPHERQRLYWLAYADDYKWRTEAALWDHRNRSHPIGWQDASDLTLRHKPLTGPAEPWDNPSWLRFPSGKLRPIERGTFPLVDGSTSNMAAVSAYGDAIVPRLAADFLIESMVQLCSLANLDAKTSDAPQPSNTRAA
jgi:DNA (cytosine-5)-methyltransferase 1